jgi:HlyD family secretion protein
MCVKEQSLSHSPAENDGSPAIQAIPPDELKATEPTAPSTRTAAPALAPAKSPAPAFSAKGPAKGKRRLWIILAVALVACGGGFAEWWRTRPQLPPGIVFGNGRAEADEIDIDTKFAGRIAEILADEGDVVKSGQVVARMDTRDLEASLKKAQADVEQAHEAIDGANADVAQQEALVLLATQEIARTEDLVKKGFATRELIDQRRQQLGSANATLRANHSKVRELQRAYDASKHDVELYSVDIADNTLVAPREGRIQYRIANTGEVLPAGGKVYTMLDIAYVYMDIYLPTDQVGKLVIGADARIVLDAMPNSAFPAKMSFIAEQAQFTPKTVETQDERDLLMFRVRLKVDPDWLRARAQDVRTGLPGVGYLRLDPTVAWPSKLQGAK